MLLRDRGKCSLRKLLQVLVPPWKSSLEEEPGLGGGKGSLFLGILLGFGGFPSSLGFQYFFYPRLFPKLLLHPKEELGEQILECPGSVPGHFFAGR